MPGLADPTAPDKGANHAVAEALGIASSISPDGRSFDYEAESDSPILVGDL
jgi:hypothetical protein